MNDKGDLNSPHVLKLNSPGMVRVKENEKHIVNRVPKFLWSTEQDFGRGQAMRILTRSKYNNWISCFQGETPTS